MPETHRTLASCGESAQQWLLRIQDQSGGWAERPGTQLNSLNTAEAVLALARAGIPAGDPQIRKAVEFLHGRRQASGAEPGAWSREVTGPDGAKRFIPDIIRTSVVVSALIAAGEGTTEQPVADAMAWLVSRQHPNDGSWSYQRGEEGEILPTCFALLTLMRVSQSVETNPWKEVVGRGLEYLTKKRRNANGSFGKNGLAGVHTTYSVLVLQAARTCRFPVLADAEAKAIGWLLDEQDLALAPIEEQIRIDPAEDGNYGFLFSTEALLLRVLADSQDASHRQTKLWNDVQRHLRSNSDGTSGGFYGRRVFSWSTANAVHAIALAMPRLTAIKPRPAESSKIRFGHFIFALALVILVAMVYLSRIGQFNELAATIFVLVMLGSLLAYGKIGEKTFGELLSRRLGKSDEPASEQGE